MAEDAHAVVNEAIVLGDRVGEEPCVHGVLQQTASSTAVKQEGVAQAAPLPCGQAVVQATVATVVRDGGRKRARRSEAWAPAPGLCCRARFEHDGRQQWFDGRIVQSHADGFEVHFQDGDRRRLPAWRLHEVEHELMDAPPVLVSQTPRILPAVITAAAVKADAEATAEVKLEASVDASKRPREKASRVHAEARPSEPKLAAPTSKIIQAKLEEFGKAARAPWEIRRDAPDAREREERRARWLTEPGGRARAVFRKACSSGAITKVMGGTVQLWTTNLHEDKVVHHVNESGERERHVLIRRGEVWIGADSNWNTWAPAFAGDDGAFRHTEHLRVLLQENQAKYDLPTVQSEFHIFRRCSWKRSDQPYAAWHGKDAAGGFLYVGKYRMDQDMVSFIHFNDLPQCTKDKRVDYDVEHASQGGFLGMDEQQIMHWHTSRVCTECQASGRGDCQSRPSVSVDGLHMRSAGDPTGRVHTCYIHTYLCIHATYAHALSAGDPTGRVSLKLP